MRTVLNLHVFHTTGNLRSFHSVTTPRWIGVTRNYNMQGGHQPETHWCVSHLKLPGTGFHTVCWKETQAVLISSPPPTSLAGLGLQSVCHVQTLIPFHKSHFRCLYMTTISTSKIAPIPPTRKSLMMGKTMKYTMGYLIGCMKVYKATVPSYMVSNILKIQFPCPAVNSVMSTMFDLQRRSSIRTLPTGCHPQPHTSALQRLMTPMCLGTVSHTMGKGPIRMAILWILHTQR